MTVGFPIGSVNLGQIRDMGLKAEILEKRIEIRDLVDRSFTPAYIKPANIGVQ